MARLLSAIVYILVFLPIWLVRRATGASRFGRLLHRAPSAWDRTIAPASLPRPQVRPRTAAQGG
jgi:hypothetical protein